MGGEDLKKVSVIMITYNHEKFIEQAIKSVLMQKTNFDFELIIGEDCSTDSTRSIVKKYYNMYPSVIRLVLPESNVGPGKNYTSVYKACSGEYVALLEGDDYWLSEDKLQKQADYLDLRRECSMCFSNAIIHYEDGRKKDEKFVKNDNKKYYNTEDILKCNNIPNMTTMVRKADILQFPEWYEKQTIGDWPSHIIRSQYGNIGYMNEVLAVYRIHSGGVSSKSESSEWILEIINMYKNLNSSLDRKYTNLINSMISKYYAELGYVFYKNNDTSLAKEYLKKSIKKKIFNFHGVRARVKLFSNLYLR